MAHNSKEVDKNHEYLQGEIMYWLENGPLALSHVRVMFQNSEFNDKFDPVSSERKFLAALEQLKKDGDITLDGAIPCDQTMIGLNVHKS